MRHCAAAIAVVLGTPATAWGDGCVIDWMGGYVRETEQRAFIEWKDGTQRLFLATRTARHAGPSLWIVPIPADPKRVDAEPIDSFPKVWATKSIAAIATEALDNIRDFTHLLDSGFWTAPLIRKPRVTHAFDSVQSELGASTGATDYGVEVYLHVEKLGMIVEVLTAQSPQALDQYLTARNVNTRAREITALESYLETSCALVCAWAARPGTPADARAVRIDFPTERVFYPLKPTSVYKSAVPTVIYVRGLFKPSSSFDLPDLSVRYLRGKIPKSDLGNSLVGDGGSEDASNHLRLLLTRVELNGPTSEWKQDLYLDHGAPAAINVARIVGYREGVPCFLLTQVGFGALFAAALPFLVLPTGRRKRSDIVWACAVGAGLVLSLVTAAALFSFWCLRRCAPSSPGAFKRPAVIGLGIVGIGLLILVPATLYVTETFRHDLSMTRATRQMVQFVAVSLLPLVATPAVLIASAIAAKWRAGWLILVVAAHGLLIFALTTATKAWLAPFA